MKTKEKAIVLVKFQDRQYVEYFYEKGLIYMNPVSHFQKIDDNNVRGDKNENLTTWLQPNKAKIVINNLEVKDIASPIAIYNSEDDVDKITHIFCIELGKTVKYYEKKPSFDKTMGDQLVYCVDGLC